MATKKTQSSRKKKENHPSRPVKKAASPKKRATAASSARNPVAVLAIMALAAAVIILMNYQKKDDKSSQPHYRVESHDAAGSEPKREQTGKVTKSGKNEEEKRETSSRKEAHREAAKKEMDTHPSEKREVRVYLVRIDETTGKSRLVAVTRKVQGDVIEGALKELINGPTAGEKKRGLLTAVPADLKIRRIRVMNRTAEIDFNAAIEQGASGSVLLDRIDQIVYTATQFPAVARVIITINGKRRETLGTDGLSIGGPIERRGH